MSAADEPRWGREDDAAAAADRLLDIAGDLFVTHGVTRVTVRDVALAAGCSRGTVHRYFADRASLRQAYVEREAARVGAAVVEQLTSVDDPGERVLTAILSALHEVRTRPVLVAWFDPAAAGTAAHLARADRTIRVLVRAFLDSLVDDPGTRAELRPGLDLDLAADWIVRIVVSLLAEPGSSTDAERRQLDQLLLPALLTTA